MRNKWFALFLCVVMTIPAYAVLKERDLPKTLGVLRLELQRNYRQQKEMMLQYEHRSADQHAELINYIKQSEQVSLILYSQKQNFTFDVAYACQEATNLYRRLYQNTMPFDEIKATLMSEIERYDSLIVSLRALPPAIREDDNTLTAEDSITLNIITDSTKLKSAATKYVEKENDDKVGLFILSEEDQRYRQDCLTYAIEIKKIMQKLLDSLEDDSYYYSVVKTKISKMYEYAQQRYKELQTSMFANSGQNYFTIISNAPKYWQYMKEDFNDKYMPLSENKALRSEWRGGFVLGVTFFMLFFIILASLLSNLILRFLPWLTKKILPKFTHKFAARFHRVMDEETYKRKRGIITLAFGVLLFAVTVMIVRGFLQRNIIIMAAEMMISFAWLVEAILVSLLIRLNGIQIKHGVNTYLPFLWLTLLIILFRIVLIPNNIINFVCPPILLIFAIWQSIAISKNRFLPLADLICSGVSLAVIILACVSSWLGYTLLAVQIIIWWTFQLACVETIFCMYDLMKSYEDNVLFRTIFATKRTFASKRTLLRDEARNAFSRHLKKGKYINKSWLYDAVIRVIIPMAAVASVPLSIYLAAGVFEMQGAFLEQMTMKFQIQDVAKSVSIMKICIIFGCFFLFKYINYLVNASYKMIRVKHKEEIGSESNETLAKNVIGFIVWGIFILFALSFLDVPKSGIELAAAGLATGMGFAMKDLLENFFYGISLMSGRVRVGDYIECDGIRGQVESIAYQSTQITTSDGSVMAFLNSALFSKNFKNLTRNHNYELQSVQVGVEYGCNIEDVRKMLVKSLNKLRTKTADGREIVDPLREIEVRFENFGESSVDLKVIMWALVDQKYTFLAKAKEVIYDTLNKNGINIPFPQRDLYIKNIEKIEKKV